MDGNFLRELMVLRSLWLTLIRQRGEEEFFDVGQRKVT